MTSLHLIGDSNVVRYLPLVKSVKDDPFIQDSTMSKAVNAVQLQEVLSSPQKVNPVVVLAAMTNPITAHPFQDYPTMINHCNKFFNEVKAWIEAGRASAVGAYQNVYIMPPMSRKTPFWYRRYFPNIMTSFREAFRSCEEGLLVLPVFLDPVFEKDYIHLNEDSGPA